MGRNFRGALEADDGLGVAVGDELIGPDASVALLVVSETRGAGFLMGFAVGAFYVRSAAGVAVRIDAELVLAARSAVRCNCERKIKLN